MALTDHDVLAVFEKQRALLRGHFKLSSGLHSDTYLQCALVLQDPAVAERLCRELAGRLTVKDIDVVIGPALGAVTMAHELARALGCRGMFMERQDGQLVLRRGFKIEPEEKVLVVEDVVTTGGSAGEVIERLKADVGCRIVGTAALVNRSGTNPFDVPFVSLLEIKPEVYKPEDCPLCKRNVPMDAPGSRHKSGGQK